MLSVIRKIKSNMIQKIKYGFSSLVVILSGKSRHSKDLLQSLKDKYKGKRCFVIGNGPSLTKEDLELLKAEVTFASNRIFRMFEQTDWRPTYYAVFDESVGSDPDVITGVNAMECSAKFVREQGWYTYRHLDDVCYIHSWLDRKYLEAPEFSEDLTKGIFTIATVTYTLIQIAKYMGFTEIYLLGVDHKYANEVKKDGTIIKNEGIKSYFGNQQKLETSIAAASWEMEKAYQFAEEYSQKNGFRIYNATRGGYLEVFERVNLDGLLNKK